MGALVYWLTNWTPLTVSIDFTISAPGNAEDRMPTTIDEQLNIDTVWYTHDENHRRNRAECQMTISMSREVHSVCSSTNNLF